MTDSKMKAVFMVIDPITTSEVSKRPIFRRIGTGFVNRDGSMNVFLDALPISGKLHIRDLVEEEKKEDEK